jgi:electron transport complex protein RnfE
VSGPAASNGSLPPVGLLALCPLLPAAGTVLTAATMSLLFLITLAGTGATMATLGRGIAAELRVLALFLVAGTWVAILDLAGRGLAWGLWSTLDVYAPLIAANALVLASVENALRGPRPAAALRHGAALGLQAMGWLLPVGALRELLGRGALLSDLHLVTTAIPRLDLVPPLPVFQTPAGAFLVLGLCAALVTSARQCGQRV